MGETYEYEVGYLLEGDYVLGLTCTPDVDVMPDQDGMVVDNFDCDFTQADCEETDPAFDFIGELDDVSVVVGTVANGDFTAP